jgi:2-keto-4-pentenoate hydratase/2-oxohepta-3-ene-1,7-dioic acid hydratase in catechol pathway
LRLATIRRNDKEMAAVILPEGAVPLGELEVSTVLNGEMRRRNTVSNMIFSPWALVSFHSKVMTLLPTNATT